jgi:hypothetical protein
MTMPWQVKALIQFVFAHVPFGERLNHLSQIANGSYSDASQLRVLLTQLSYIRRLNDRFSLPGKTVVEIGPGWQGTGTLALALFEVKRIYAFDNQPHLRLPLILRLVRTCLNNTGELSEQSGIPEEKLSSILRALSVASTLGEVLSLMNVTYVAPGDAGATGLTDSSVDMVFSYGVLEHISMDGLNAIARETARILKPSGRVCHNIGLHDHFHNAGLGNGVNFLRYPEWLWAFFCYNKILYHNRLRLPHYLQLFEQHGLRPTWMDTELLQLNLDAQRAIKVNERFAGLTETELATSHLYVDLERA